MRCCLVLSSSSHCAALSLSNRAGWLLRRLLSRRRLDSRHTALSSSCRPLTVPPSRPLTVPPSRRLIAPSGCCFAPHRAVVLSSHCPLTPNVTRGARDDGGHCLQLPRTSNFVVGVGLAIASPLPSTLPWMLFLALQPCSHSNCSCRRRQCPFCRPPPSPTLVAVTITITLFVAITIARPPPLSPSP